MLPSPIFSFENFKDLDIIVELKRLQKQIIYFVLDRCIKIKMYTRYNNLVK